MKTRVKPGIINRFTCTVVAITCLLFLQIGSATAKMKAPPPTVVDVIIIGDRVVDIAYNLGVLPKAMSVRGGMWPMAKKLKMVSQILGCPNCISKNKDIVPKACTTFGVKRIIVERSKPYCLYKSKVSPEGFLKDIDTSPDVTIEYVDFSGGLEQAIKRTATLLDRSAKAEEVIAKYKKQLAKAEKGLSQKAAGKKVVIFNGTFQPSSGKSTLRVEAPGGYADTFILSKLGCINAGDAFKPQGGKADKGHYPVKKNKNGMILTPLVTANPDVIVMTGDAFAVERALADAVRTNPEFANIKAIKNMSVYSLPIYIDAGVLEYPGVLRKWTAALTN